MTETAPALELQGIDMHYGFVRALDTIDFTSVRARWSGSSVTTVPGSRPC